MKSSTYSPLFLFIKRLLIVFLFYQGVRVAFYLYNQSFFPEIDFELFLGGISFDLSTSGYINLIFGVLHLFPGAFQENKRYQKTLFLSFFSVNTLFISLNFIDFEYFRFIGRRSSFSMMTAEGVEQKILGLMKSYIVDYWQSPLIFIGFNIALWYCLGKMNNRPIQSFSYAREDHTSSSANEVMYKNNIGKFRIPILFYRPSDESLVGVTQKNFQQINIFPSLMDYLQLNAKVVSFGKSYISNSDFVVNYLDNVYNLEIDDHYLAFDGKKSLGLFNWKNDPLLKENLMNSHPLKLKEMEVFIKAYIQSYNSRVSKNELVTNR